jgi:HEAT repeat protein
MPTYEKPELLLKSALEKIVYFEARQEQLLAESKHAIAKLETLRQQLECAQKREVDLSKTLAEMQLRLRHTQAERDEALEKIETLRRERTEWVGKILEAAQIQNPAEADTFDLAHFIALLRGELLNVQNNPQATNAAPPVPQSTGDLGASFAAQGRLNISTQEQKTLQADEKPLADTVLELGIRELSSSEPHTRLRTALRLKSLGRASAAPALAQAIHAETEPEVLIALIDAFSALAKTEGIPFVAPHANAPHPKLRLAAIRALIHMDPLAATPQLLAALEDVDSAVRRRATLWLMGLSPEETLRLGSVAFEDKNPEVRAIATYVLSISQQEAARPRLLRALNDENLKVRMAAAKALSKHSKADWTSLPSLEQAERQRALRRLKYPHSGLASSASPSSAPPSPLQFQRKTQTATLTLEPTQQQAQPTKQHVQQPEQPHGNTLLADNTLLANGDMPSEALSSELLSALRSSLRGKTQEELISLTGASMQNLSASLWELQQQGHVIQRRQKYFIA